MKHSLSVTNVLERIVMIIRQYEHEMQKNLGWPQALARSAASDAPASRQGDS